jgi:GxxExxY protein
METDMSQDVNKITEKIIGCAYIVGRTLGSGFLEKVYENALSHELSKARLAVRTQWPIRVFYDGVLVGDYVADVLVEDTVLVEAKSASALTDAHLAQCLNYLKATGLKVCLLINFGGSSVEVKRIVHNL